MGLNGVEVYYPSHSPKAMKTLLKMAQDLGLLISGGSDFHDSGRSGNKVNDWVRKTNIPYNLVAEMKKIR